MGDVRDVKRTMRVHHDTMLINQQKMVKQFHQPSMVLLSKTINVKDFFIVRT